MKREIATDIAVSLVALSVIGLGVGPAVYDWYGHLFDDAYIYLRYVQNLATCPLEWNCGYGRVEGFTSPAYLSLLGMLHAVFGADLEGLASALGVATWLAAIAGFSLLPLLYLERSNPVRLFAPVCIAGAFFGDQLIAQNATSGMEGGLVALATLAVAILARAPERLHWFAPWAVLVRPEMGLFTLAQPLLGRAHLKRALGYAVAVFALVTVGRLALFTDVLPNTFWAKSGGSADHLAAGGQYVLESITRFPLAAMALFVTVFGRGPLRYLAAVHAGWVAYFLWSGGDFYPYSRVYAFLTPMATFVTVCWLAGLLRERAVHVAAIAAVACVGLAQFGHSFRDTYDPAGGYSNVQRWADLGKYLGRCLPEQSIAATPIGAIAYFSGANVFDMVGLTDSRLAMAGDRITGEHFQVGHERSDPQWILGLDPKIIMFDVATPKPLVPGQRPKLHMFVELELARALASHSKRYLPYSVPIGDEFQLLLIGEDARWTEDLEGNQCL